MIQPVLSPTDALNCAKKAVRFLVKPNDSNIYIDVAAQATLKLGHPRQQLADVILISVQTAYSVGLQQGAAAVHLKAQELLKAKPNDGNAHYDDLKGRPLTADEQQQLGELVDRPTNCARRGDYSPTAEECSEARCWRKGRAACIAAKQQPQGDPQEGGGQ